MQKHPQNNTKSPKDTAPKESDHRTEPSDWGSPEQFRKSDTRGFDYRGYEDFQHLETFHTAEEPEDRERWGMMRGYENEDRHGRHGKENFRPSENDPRFVSTCSTDERQLQEGQIPPQKTSKKSTGDEKQKTDKQSNDEQQPSSVKQNPSH